MVVVFLLLTILGAAIGPSKKAASVKAVSPHTATSELVTPTTTPATSTLPPVTTAPPTSSRSTTSTTTASPSTTAAPPPTTAPRPGPDAGDPNHPNPALSPGAAIAELTAGQVCTPGYSASVRNVSQSVKDQVYAEYGIRSHPTGAYEVDHLISLELGGSNDIRNLWPEPYGGPDGAHSKDVVENRLHREMCSGRITLTAAQYDIVHWDTLNPTLPSTAAPPTTRYVPATTPASSGPHGGATARCNDGTFSYAAHHQGACSRHGGVAVFYK